jgi:NADH:ubiquinone oxidoreductase subunit 2 (subunit N)
LFQIFPDWFLSAQLNVLVFPEDGLFKIGSVSGYMIGLWTIPLFIICFIGVKIKEQYSHISALVIVGLISLGIFAIAEQTLWMLQSWYPQNVTLLFDHLAVYIIIPEVILGLSTFYYYEKMKSEHIILVIIVAFGIMLLYLGSASFFYFLFEKIIFV